MFKYRLFWPDGSEAGEAAYAVYIQAGETILVGSGRKLRVLDAVPVDEPDSEYVGLLKVQAVFPPERDTVPVDESR